jgi:hypothetical protein
MNFIVKEALVTLKRERKSYFLGDEIALASRLIIKH